MEVDLLSRRALIRNGTLLLGGIAFGSGWKCLDGDERPTATVGLVTDIHHANKEHAGSRYYRQSLPKLDQALREFKARKVDRIVHLGDLVDSHPTAAEEQEAAKLVAQRFRATSIPFNFLLGNHCLYNMDKRRYAEMTGTKGSYESFELGGFRFVCLDACYRADGVSYANNNFVWKDTFVPEEQLAWMRHEIDTAKGPCIVLTHQLLDFVADSTIVNHEAIRPMIAKSGKVAAVIQGHHHQNRLMEHDQIPYTVLRSIVDGAGLENSGYSVLSLYKDGSLKIEGFAEQKSYPRGARRH